METKIKKRMTSKINRKDVLELLLNVYNNHISLDTYNKYNKQMVTFINEIVKDKNDIIDINDEKYKEFFNKFILVSNELYEYYKLSFDNIIDYIDKNILLYMSVEKSVREKLIEESKKIIFNYIVTFENIIMNVKFDDNEIKLIQYNILNEKLKHHINLEEYEICQIIKNKINRIKINKIDNNIENEKLSDEININK